MKNAKKENKQVGSNNSKDYGMNGYFFKDFIN